MEARRAVLEIFAVVAVAGVGTASPAALEVRMEVVVADTVAAGNVAEVVDTVEMGIAVGIAEEADTATTAGAGTATAAVAVAGRVASPDEGL